MLPTFMVIGAAKCGTTSVCDILSGHPDVFMATPKEPHYFGLLQEYNYVSRRAWYESLFDDATGYRAIGEGSVSSSRPNSVHSAAHRIRDVIPNCRLIYMVRHPIRRFESDWRMLRHEGQVSASIERAVEEMPSLISWAFYWRHLNVYRDLFPDEQLLVVFLEDFARDPTTELARICRHIGVTPPSAWPEPDRPRNAANEYRAAGRLARWTKGRPWYEAVRAHLPGVIVEMGKRMLTRQKRYHLRMTTAFRSALIEAYRDDAAHILEYCGKPVDFWNLDA